MFKKRLLIFSIILVILTAGIVSAQDNSTDSITENATVQNDEKTFDDIQLAIDNCEENGTVELEGTYIRNGSTISINKSITLDGKNHTTLNGNRHSGILKITNVTVCFKNINFINSYSEAKAAITSDGNLSFENCYFKNNIMDMINHEYDDGFEVYDRFYPKNYAGAVYSKGALKVSNCTFEDNHATCTDITVSRIYDEYDDYEEITNYIYYHFAGAISAFSELTISNSQFIDSSVTSMKKTTITNSSFRKTNNALGISGDSDLINCNFTQNSGYVIKINSEKNVSIQNCYFADNDYEYSDYENNIKSYYNINLTVLNSTFNGSKKSSIYTEGNVFLINSNFYDNGETAVKSNNITAINCTFKNNKDDYSAGLYGNNIYLKDNTFTNNKACAVIATNLINTTQSLFLGQAALNDSLNGIELINIKTITSNVAYASGKYPQIKAIYTESGNAANYYIEYQIFKGGKLIEDYYMLDNIYEEHTNSKGIINLKIPNYSPGTYQIKIRGAEGIQYQISKKTITIKITKAKTVIKAPKITAKYKKSKYFKILVKHATTKKVVKNTYVKVKIDKKTYKVKTNSKGIAKINTKKLKVGKHKVYVSSGNTNYQMSAKSLITIKR